MGAHHREDGAGEPGPDDEPLIHLARDDGWREVDDQCVRVGPDHGSKDVAVVSQYLDHLRGRARASDRQQPTVAAVEPVLAGGQASVRPCPASSRHEANTCDMYSELPQPPTASRSPGCGR